MYLHDQREWPREAAACAASTCTLIMPPGKRCGSPAMRNQKFWYHHSRNHTGHERAQARDRMLARLDSKISAMNTAELLHFLYGQLGRLNKTLNRFPDIHYTLLASLERIAEIGQMESILRRKSAGMMNL